ncbi:Cof-type HAD-IIB family hydrolase [Radiobacillus sp. PE A8.2]|uniref:Cof-type HAD-IIB family hydrolase n=1 Tax=Radiobacillus sp. PE A8.2 TaxID=3380349 RepID=UPI003890084E
MNHQVKAVFLDMDGTILNDHNRASDRLKLYIQQLRQNGVYVFIATGRTLMEISDVIPDDFEVDGIVSSNGMVVTIGEEKLAENALPAKLVEDLVDRARKNHIYYEVHPNQGQRFSLEKDKSYIIEQINDPKPDGVEESEWRSRKEAITEDIEWVDSLQPKNVSKFYFFSKDRAHINQWINELNQLKQTVDFTTSSSTPHNVEVMVAGVNKATGIAYLLDKFNLDKKDVLAIGDSHNDIQMFELVGHAVAMKNADDTMKSLADEVCEYTNEEDGVYHYLQAKFNI